MDNKTKVVKDILVKALSKIDNGDDAMVVANFVYDNIRTIRHLEKRGMLTKDAENFPKGEYLAVDAGCRKNPGPTEYRGVLMPSGREYFRVLPFNGTNNLGEFLAIVHAFAKMKLDGISLPVYSDSEIAINWVNKKMCKTDFVKYKLDDSKHLADRALKWLNTHDYEPPRKWKTRDWGEIPADYGRK